MIIGSYWTLDNSIVTSSTVGFWASGGAERGPRRSY